MGKPLKPAWRETPILYGEDARRFTISEKGDEYTIASLGWTTEWDAIQVELTNNGKRAHFYIHMTVSANRYHYSA